MNFQSLFDQRSSYLWKLTPVARGGIIFCIVAGLVTFAGGIATGEATRTWGSFLFNLLYFFVLGLGGVAFAGMQDVIGAKWGRPMMRLHESFASFLPVGACALVVFLLSVKFNLLGAGKVYKWVADPAMLHGFWGKDVWLQVNFMVLRDLFALGLIVGLSYWQMKNKLRADQLLMQGKKEEGLKQGHETRKKLRYWSAPVLVVYALSFSLLAFDLTMSLSPLWFSTLWGGWSFAVMMQTLMATLLIFMYAVRKNSVGQILQRQNYHDIGKMMHGFTIFFAYLTYAHIITYWFGNVPEETEYFIHRMHGPWFKILLVIPFLVFGFPLFALLPKASKWTVYAAVPICSSILVAQWLVGLLVVMPEVADGATWGVPWIELGMFLGFLGAFIGSVSWFSSRYPMVAIGDVLLHHALESGDH